MWNDPRISEIIKLESEITEAIYHGHHPSGNDQYQSQRERIAKLREEVGIKPWFNKPKAKQESSEDKS